MAANWIALVTLRVPCGGKMLNTTTNAYEQPTTNRLVEVVVPDAGGYFNTKALLESSYGFGSVNALREKN
jgi:hypothetical protein